MYMIVADCRPVWISLTHNKTVQARVGTEIDNETLTPKLVYYYY